MEQIQKITACLDSFPQLEGKKIGLFYSGGLDSQTVAAALLKKGYDITLITIDNGASVNEKIIETAVYYLSKLNYSGKIKEHVMLSSFGLFQALAIRQTANDIKNFGIDYTCLGCKLSMLAVSIVYARENNIETLLDGFVRAQEFYPEQTNAYIEFIDLMCKENGIDHHSPIYTLDDKETVKSLAVMLGVPPRSLDSSCLFEERPIPVDEKKIEAYLQSKKRFIEDYIEMNQLIIKE
ncbi:MAG: 7-cyano-7-deazaguanine synthase [Desulfobacter sp.]